MIDREKVIKGLERCKLYNKVNCDKCPYDYNGRGNEKNECTAELVSDAIALLKEHEQDIQNLIADLDDLRKEHEKLLDKKIPLITSGQEVIRCKDCRFRDDPNSVISEWLPCQFARTPDDWFCACGLTVRENRTVERR